MTTSYTLTGDFNDLLGEEPRVTGAWLETNLPAGTALVDLDANKVLLAGPKRITLDASNVFSISLIATNSTGTNVTDGTLRYRVRAQYSDGTGVPRTWESGFFDLTAAADLSDKAGGAGDLDVTIAPSASLIDAPTAANVTGPSQTRTALDAAIEGKIETSEPARRARTPLIVPLITGSDEETFSRIGFNAPTVDAVNAKINDRAWSFVASGNTLNPTIEYVLPNGPMTLRNPAQAICMWVYIPDVTDMTGMTVTLYQDSAKAEFIVRGTAGGDFKPQTLVNGWNFLRFTLGPVWKPEWTGTQIYSVMLRAQMPSTNTSTIVLAHTYLECPPQARMIMVLDRGYRSAILNGGVARLRAAKIPITWAIDVTAMGGAVGTGGEAITLEEIYTMWEEGDSISFHGWDGAPTSSMTDAERRTDAMRSIKYLAQQGYEGRMWRAAWVQNTGNREAIRDLLLGQAFDNGSASVNWPQATNMEAWPPGDMHSIYRWNVHGAHWPSGDPRFSELYTYVDAVFNCLQATNGLVVPYIHGILGPDGSTGAAAGVPGNDITPEKWDYFMDKVEAGIAAGWLRATTFEDLWRESGGSFSDMGGGAVATWVDPDGSARTKNLP